MTVRKLLACIAVASLATAPVAAQEAKPVPARASAPAQAESAVAGKSTLFFLAAIVGVALGIVLLINNDDPSSP